MARPLKKLAADEWVIWNLAIFGCTFEEISRITKVDRNTLDRRFGELIKDGYAKMQCSIRRAQIKLALKGNPAMLIWLGKILLHQKESLEVNLGASDTLTAFVQQLRQQQPDDAGRLQGQTQTTRQSLPDKGRKNGENLAVPPQS